MPKTVCIICGKEKRGIDVADDLVLDSIRWFKQNVTHNERGNRLVVCRECYPKYAASRKKFESRQRLYLGLGIVFALLNVTLSRTLASVGISLLILLLFICFSLMSYSPRINIKKQHSQ
ncbi:MAG: hypothetical protein KGI04_00895 [Candidatus Micrarchaeota archaeon]|nr:hypothetical protein [Candidatus Micrarchaeota archaeon]